MLQWSFYHCGVDKVSTISVPYITPTEHTHCSSLIQQSWYFWLTVSGLSNFPEDGFGGFSPYHLGAPPCPSHPLPRRELPNWWLLSRTQSVYNRGSKLKTSFFKFLIFLDFFGLSCITGLMISGGAGGSGADVHATRTSIETVPAEAKCSIPPFPGKGNLSFFSSFYIPLPR